MKRDIGALQKAVIEASENRFWEEAVCEWEIMDCYIDENSFLYNSKCRE